MVELLLGALVVAGMATGTNQRFDRGTTTLMVVLLVQIVGAAFLIGLVAVLRACVAAWRGRRTHLLAWFPFTALVWLIWAFFRVIEYSS